MFNRKLFRRPTTSKPIAENVQQEKDSIIESLANNDDSIVMMNPILPAKPTVAAKQEEASIDTSLADKLLVLTQLNKKREELQRKTI